MERHPQTRPKMNLIATAPRMVRRRIGNVALVLALLSSFSTYLTDEGKLVAYITAAIVFGVTVCIIGASFKNARTLGVFSTAYLLIACASLLANMHDFETFPAETIIYPVIFFLICSSLWKIFLIEGAAAHIALGLFVGNGALAMAGLLGVSEIPLLGEIERGRAIFFTNIPSSAGLVWNVNYYAATQAVGFWFLFSLLKRGALNKSSTWLIYFVAFSVLLGSSRSCTLAMLASFLIYTFISGRKGAKSLILVGTAALAVNMTTLYVIATNDDQLSSGFRLYKGLNSRDELWTAGMELASDKLLVGYGSPKSIRHELSAIGAPTVTVQNTFLATQLLFGIGGTLLVILLTVIALGRLIIRHTLRPEDAAVFSLASFALTDSLVRSYMFGGIGIVPFLFLAALAYLYRVERK